MIQYSKSEIGTQPYPLNCNLNKLSQQSSTDLIVIGPFLWKLTLPGTLRKRSKYSVPPSL